MHEHINIHMHQYTCISIYMKALIMGENIHTYMHIQTCIYIFLDIYYIYAYTCTYM